MTTTTANAHVGQTPIRQLPPCTVDGVPHPGGWSAHWARDFADVLWRLGVPASRVPTELAKIQSAGLDDHQLDELLELLRRQARAYDDPTWQDGGQVQPPAKTPPPSPDQGPTRTNPSPPHVDGHGLIKLLIGAGVVGGVGVSLIAARAGARNVRALRATAAAFSSGSIGQGGLQAIQDALLGARFARGIGTMDYVAAAMPGVNRIGRAGRLVSVARGHVDHLDMIASAAALRRMAGDSVAIHAPTRETVVKALRRGGNLGSVLDDLDRSAAGARPVFDDAQLLRYHAQGSVLESGTRLRGSQLVSGETLLRPQLAIDPHGLVETGRTTRINRLIVGRDAQLGSGNALAASLGTTQGLNVSTLNPAMQRSAMAASGVDPELAERIGLPGAFVQRWQQRLAGS